MDSQKPRQMWDLDPETEKRLAVRSIWVRGLGISSNREEVRHLLERTGDIPQRFRTCKKGTKDRHGEFVIYATYKTEEAANLNMSRLKSTIHHHHQLDAMKAQPEGGYRPLTQEMKNTIALRNMTKEDKQKIIKKKKALEKLDKIRQLNGTLRDKPRSSSSEGGNRVATEASRSKEDPLRKRKSAVETSSSNRDAVDKKRIRQEEPKTEPPRKETEERKGERERRGPRTPPTPPNIDRREKDDRNPFLADDDLPRSSHSSKKHHRDERDRWRGRETRRH